MAAHILPSSCRWRSSGGALGDADRFMAEMSTVCEMAPEEAAPGSPMRSAKGFVRWYSSSQAERFNTGVCMSVAGFRRHRDGPAPARNRAGAGALVADAAVPRWGKAEEMADLLAFCVSDKTGYLTGTDILNDGGVVASIRERARIAAANG